MSQRTTLEQWQALRAMAGHASMTAAADALGKSQSTLSYLIAQLEGELGAKLVERDGRRNVLTDAGKVLLDQASHVLDEVDNIEARAKQLARGREAVVRLAVDAAFPSDLLVAALMEFEKNSIGTRVELHEAVMSGVNQLLMDGSVDIALGLEPPQGYLSDPLIDISLILVAKSDHKLFQVGRSLSVEDLSRNVQVVVRDSGPQNLSRGWISPTHRWSVSNIHAARNLILSGLCYGRLPAHLVKDELESGNLVALPIVAGGTYSVTFHLTKSPTTGVGPAVAQLVDVLKAAASGNPRSR